MKQSIEKGRILLALPNLKKKITSVLLTREKLLIDSMNIFGANLAKKITANTNLPFITELLEGKLHGFNAIDTCL